MACACSPDDRLRRVLMVRRLHPAVTMQSLLQTFGAFGSITGCKVFTHKSGRSAGCASVEFASHTAACSAFRELQGSQLNGKNIHLQWFDPTLAQSPGKPSGQNLGLAMSPGGEASILAGKSSFGNGFSVPCTPHEKSSGQVPHMNTSPFGLLASSPHNPYCNGVAVAAAAAAAAAHQHQLVQEHQRQQQAAALLANGGHMQYAQQQYHRWPPSMYPRQQQQLHRQVSAPSSGLQVPPSPHPSTGGSSFDALTSPGPCMHANSDPGSMAAAVASLSAAMAVANAPLASQEGSNSLAALQQLAAMQQQQLQRQFTASAIQQLSTSSQHSDSPLSPVRSVHGQQQTQQNAFALAAALHSQQQAQLLQQQLSGQLPSPAPRKQQQQQQEAKLQLARSMPAALGASCVGMGSKGKLHGSAFELPGAASILQQQQHLQDSYKHALGSAGHTQQISPFALNQQAPESSTPAATNADRHHTQGSRSALAAPALEPVDTDTVPMSLKSLQGNTGKAQHSKKQLFRDEHGIERGHHGLSLLQSGSHRGYVSETGVGAAGMSEYGNTLQQGMSTMAAEGPSRTSCIDDTSVAGVDMLAASSTVNCSISYPLSSCWAGQDQALDALTPDLLASLQQQQQQQQQHMPQPDSCSSPMLCNSRSAAAALQQQQLQLLAGSMGTQPQTLAGLLPLHQQHDMQCSMPMAVADGTGMVADAMGEWPMRPARVRVRASDSQVLLGGNRNQCSDAAAAGFRLSSPSLPDSYESPAHGTASATGTASAVAAHAWQCAMLGSSSDGSSNVQQQQQARVSTSNLAAAAGLAAMPASEVFKHKHKQQLQLELPEYDLVSAPLTSAQLSGPLESFDQLITTEVMPDSHAAAAPQSHLGVSGAMLSGATAAGLHGYSELGNEYGNSSSDGGWADWSSSMAALLSPMHLPCMVARRFTDSYTATDHSTLQMQREQQQLRQQHSRSVAGCMSTAPVGRTQAGRSSTGLLGDSLAGLSLVSKSQGFGTAAESAALGAVGMQQQEQPGSDLSFSAFGMTRHSSLCLDAHPQLQPFGALATSQAAPSTVRSGAVHTCSSSSSSNHGPNSQLKRGLLNDGGGLYSSGSFTFMPPVLAQQRQQQSRFGNAGHGYDAMITEPFQMPAFFRSGGSSVPSTQQQQSVSRNGGGGSSESPNKVASVPLPSVVEGTDQQQRTSNENCGIESDAVAASSAAQHQLHHSFSLPAKIEPLVEPSGCVGCARKAQQQQLNQQQSDEVPYSDVFKSLWGPQQDEGSTEQAA